MRKTLLLALIFAPLALAGAQSVGEIETKLEVENTLSSPSEIAPGKRMLIRNFYTDSQLKYGNDGKPAGAHLGLWLGDGYVEVATVEETSDERLITAKRLRGLFVKGRKLRFKETREKMVLNVPKNQPLETVFVGRDEELLPMISVIWRKFLTNRSAYPDSENLTKIHAGVSAPQPIYSPAPAAPAAENKARDAGTVSFVCVVDENGRVRDVEIAKPAGGGLDEKGAEAVTKWRFRPAISRKQSVPIRIQIDVDFHLY